MVIKNEDLKTMVKMENLIGKYEKIIFGENKDKKIKCCDNTITYEDFIKYINLIEKAIDNKKECSRKSNIRNKAKKEYHKIVNSISYYKKIDNKEKLEYWQEKLRQYKERGY